MDLIDLADDEDQLEAFVNVAIKLMVSSSGGGFGIS